MGDREGSRGIWVWQGGSNHMIYNRQVGLLLLPMLMIVRMVLMVLLMMLLMVEVGVVRVCSVMWCMLGIVGGAWVHCMMGGVVLVVHEAMVIKRAGGGLVVVLLTIRVDTLRLEL